MSSPWKPPATKRLSLSAMVLIWTLDNGLAPLTFCTAGSTRKFRLQRLVTIKLKIENNTWWWHNNSTDCRPLLESAGRPHWALLLLSGTGETSASQSSSAPGTRRASKQPTGGSSTAHDNLDHGHYTRHRCFRECNRLQINRTFYKMWPMHDSGKVSWNSLIHSVIPHAQMGKITSWTLYVPMCDPTNALVPPYNFTSTQQPAPSILAHRQTRKIPDPFRFSTLTSPCDPNHLVTLHVSFGMASIFMDNIQEETERPMFQILCLQSVKLP
jgi:hypothetical protein